MTLLSQYSRTGTLNLQLNPIKEVEHTMQTYYQQLSDDLRMVGIGFNQLHQATQHAQQWKQTKQTIIATMSNACALHAHYITMMMCLCFVRHILDKYPTV